MLNEVSSKIILALALLPTLAALLLRRYGRANANTKQSSANERNANNSKLMSRLRRIVRCGTWRTNIKEGNSIFFARVRRTRCTMIGTAIAVRPSKNHGLRNDMA